MTFAPLLPTNKLGPDDRLETVITLWDGSSPLEPQIISWASVRYARSSLVQEVTSSDLLEIPETFIYPCSDDRYLVYSPLVGEVGLVNGDAAKVLRLLRVNYPNPWLATFAPNAYRYVVDFLRRDTHLIQPKSRFRHKSQLYRSRVDLCLTSACNLRCGYCFASAGQRPQFMSWEIAKTALDLTVRRALREGRVEIEVAFQGDGEQFLAWPMMVRCTDYVRNLTQHHGIDLRIWAITNGYLNLNMVEWAVENLDSLAISLDGPPDIHDAQRPTPSGKRSSKQIFEIIRRLDQLGARYSLRATITFASVNRMTDIVRFVAENFPRTRCLVLDPLFPSYLSKEMGWMPPSSQEFVQGFLEAQRLADVHGLQLGYTGYHLEEITGYHCDAWGVKLAIMPSGLVSSCPIVASWEDKRADFCIYGSYSDGQFRYDWGRLRRILARNLDGFPECANCIARWHCAGECYARLLMISEQDEPLSSFRCQINRELLSHELLRMVA